MIVRLISGSRALPYSSTSRDFSAEKLQKLSDAGGRAATSIADAVADADVVCVMVPDSPQVQDVLTSEDGVFAGERRLHQRRIADGERDLSGGGVGLSASDDDLDELRQPLAVARHLLREVAAEVGERHLEFYERILVLV